MVIGRVQGKRTTTLSIGISNRRRSTMKLGSGRQTPSLKACGD
jgi:hypothetical protein